MGPENEEETEKDQRPLILPTSLIHAQQDAEAERAKSRELAQLLENYDPKDFLTLRPIRRWFEEGIYQSSTDTRFVVRPKFLMGCIARCLKKIDKKYLRGFRNADIPFSGQDGVSPDVDFDAQMQYASYRYLLAERYSRLREEFYKDEDANYYRSVFEVLSSQATSLNIWVTTEDAEVCAGKFAVLEKVDDKGAWKNHKWEEVTEYIIEQKKAPKGRGSKAARTKAEYMKAVSGGVHKRKKIQKDAKKSRGSTPGSDKKNEYVIVVEELDGMEITEEDYEMGDQYVSENEEEKEDPNLGNKSQGDGSKTGEGSNVPDNAEGQGKGTQPQDKSTGNPVPPSTNKKSSKLQDDSAANNMNSFGVRKDGEDVIIDEDITAVFFRGRPVARCCNSSQIILAIGPRSSPIHRILLPAECNVAWDQYPKISNLDKEDRRAGKPEFHGMLRGISAVAFVDANNRGPEAIDPRKRQKGFRMPLTYVLLSWRDGHKTWEPRSNCKNLSLPRRSSKAWDQRIYDVAVKFQNHHEKANPDSEIFRVPNIKVEEEDEGDW
ncbi:hypothetical protein AOL_s00091g60 [Orbilia oligospora ATCC 24927]|uniref:Uncharacterized protein n=1 Tax=Arthrobotrys oligospora (strain ATCC 24927 / CBS 115.81 / DSM 1491) TaxID=756982 RepID=G1XI08_ARTOA|nr:hypothetical protein AOL_s00091g60 [Orbilia oligospora ATCC 24927]EGX47239.1 hypothetical protein AOL_s00091g60 [Orbilia oligospora ATCC 24927]